MLATRDHRRPAVFAKGKEVAVAARKRYLTTRELSEHLNVPMDTIEYWRKRGRGPRHVKFEGSVRYPVVELEKYEQDPEGYQRQRDLEVNI
jgi:hypothetical protein